MRRRLGIQGGINFQNINGKDGSGEKLTNSLITGFHAGVNINIPVATDFYFQPGLLFSVKGSKNDFFSPPQKHQAIMQQPQEYLTLNCHLTFCTGH